MSTRQAVKLGDKRFSQQVNCSTSSKTLSTNQSRFRHKSISGETEHRQVLNKGENLRDGLIQELNFYFQEREKKRLLMSTSRGRLELMKTRVKVQVNEPLSASKAVASSAALGSNSPMKDSFGIDKTNSAKKDPMFLLAQNEKASPTNAPVNRGAFPQDCGSSSKTPGRVPFASLDPSVSDRENRGKESNSQPRSKSRIRFTAEKSTCHRRARNLADPYPRDGRPARQFHSPGAEDRLPYVELDDKSALLGKDGQVLKSHGRDTNSLRKYISFHAMAVERALLQAAANTRGRSVERNCARARDLLRAGVNPDCPVARDSCPELWSPLHWAALRGDANFTRLLLKAGADPDARSRVLQTPLHVASIYGYAACVKELLKAGAGLTAVDRDNKSAWVYAVEYRRTDVSAALEKYILKNKNKTLVGDITRR